MSTTYTINLINQSAQKNFVFYQSQPIVSGDGLPLDKGHVLPSVWVSKGCPSQGQIQIKAAVQFYAWDGTINKQAAVGLKVVNGKSLPAKLGQNQAPGSTFDASLGNNIVDLAPAQKDTAVAGAFEIDTGAFAASANVLIGMSSPSSDDPNLMSPTAVINATGQMVYQIFPVNDYYVFVSDAEVGEIFNYQAWSQTAGKLEFSKNPGKFTATIVYTNTGSWSPPAYS